VFVRPLKSFNPSVTEDKMGKTHEQVVTTSPVAIKCGQERVHIEERTPFNFKTGNVKCSKCDTVFELIGDFPIELLLGELATDHQEQEPHPDVIVSESSFTRIIECNCDLPDLATKLKPTPQEGNTGGIES
jgi:hypothetical protein